MSINRDWSNQLGFILTNLITRFIHTYCEKIVIDICTDMEDIDI